MKCRSCGKSTLLSPCKECEQAIVARLKRETKELKEQSAKLAEQLRKGKKK